MWFLFTILTTLAWAFADLFYKKGSDEDDKTSHLKIIVNVGFVMGIHAILYMLIKHISFDPINMIKYLPVSILYILSMAIGYVGLRYIELSISSPVQNSSGAITAILLVVFFQKALSYLEIMGIIITTSGVIILAILEKRQELKQMKLDNVKVDKKYQFSFLAIMFPILYSLIDGLGTFTDGVYLDELKLMSESDALLAYEFTFLIVAILVYLYLIFIKKEKMSFKKDSSKTFAAIFETVGQFFYVFAISANALISSSIISSYSIFSVILSAIFLKERLTKANYLAVVYVIIGILLLGISEGISEDEEELPVAKIKNEKIEYLINL